jgi:hypothetical protein
VRFLRRDGLRIFLDSRDLIALVEHDRPINTRDFARQLTHRNGRLVLTYTNVTEFLPRQKSGTVDSRRAVELVRKLEQLPLSYIRQPDLMRREFLEAIRAFSERRPVLPLDPYVSQWWETFSRTPSEFVPFLKPRMAKTLQQFSLSEEVERLLESGKELSVTSQDVAPVGEAMQEDRDVHHSRRGVPETWLAAVEKPFVSYGWPHPPGGITTFADFLRSTPNACPAWRFGVAMYEESRANLTAPVRVGDISDFSHVHFLPYVTHATLDRSWRDRLERANRRLAQTMPHERRYTNVYANTEAILAEW